MSYNRRTGEFSFEHGRADAGTAAHIALDQFTTRREYDPGLPGPKGSPGFSRGSDNKPGGRDLIGHSSVQAWSAGPLFPCVIAVVERYTMTGEFRSRSFELMLDGRSEEYASREDAERAARMLLTYPSMRARWINGEEA